jgi:hypothetical protein
MAAAHSAGVPISSHLITEVDVGVLYESALVLVRPDGHVAWRSDQEPADPDRLIRHVTGR